MAEIPKHPVEGHKFPRLQVVRLKEGKEKRAQDWDAFQDQLGQAQAVRTRMEMNKVTLTIAQTTGQNTHDAFL